MKVETSGVFTIGNRRVEIVNDISYDSLSYIVNNIENMMNGMISRDTFEYLGEGSYGCVYGYEGYAIKVLFESDFGDNRYCNDVQVLKDLSHLSCVPRLYAVIDNRIIITERIFGVTVDEYCCGDYYGNSSLIDESFVNKWDNALLDVVVSGYSPNDLHESNVMIDFETARPVFIDLGFFNKHGYNYESCDEEALRSDDGYSKANDWAGKTIRGYASKYASI